MLAWPVRAGGRDWAPLRPVARRPDRPARPSRTALSWTRLAPVAATGVGMVALHAVGPGRLAGPVFLGGLLLGVPHGAADHITVARAENRQPSGRETTATAVLYALGVVVALLCLWVSPSVALTVALALSAYHFGTGETGALRHGRTVAAAFGLLPILGPFVAWPVASDRLLAGLAPTLAAHWQAGMVTGGTAVLVVIGAAGMITALRRRDWAVAGELGLLALLVAVLPPLAAFGLYFGLWHAPRHIARLVDLGRPAGTGPWLATPPSGRTTWRALIRAAWLPTLIAYISLAGAWALLPSHLWADVGLAGLLAVTAPHTIIVAGLVHRVRDGGRNSGVRLRP
jgi:Brp/Blh family beta-carotene 15,15'-monooxygenase